MHLLRKTAAYHRRVQQGRYIARSLRRDKQTEQAEKVEGAAGTVKLRGRALEDAEEPIQEAMADRDAAFQDLQSAAQEARHSLASGGVQAAKELPYTAVFDVPIAYYKDAPLPEVEKRYGGLLLRFTTHLTEDHPVRLKTVPRLHASLEGFATGSRSVETAQNLRDMAATALEQAERDFDQVLEQVYGSLVEKLGRKGAERFFPRTTVKGKAEKKAEQ